MCEHFSIRTLQVNLSDATVQTVIRNRKRGKHYTEEQGDVGQTIIKSKYSCENNQTEGLYRSRLLIDLFSCAIKERGAFSPAHNLCFGQTFATVT